MKLKLRSKLQTYFCPFVSPCLSLLPISFVLFLLFWSTTLFSLTVLFTYFSALSISSLFLLTEIIFSHGFYFLFFFRNFYIISHSVSLFFPFIDKSFSLYIYLCIWFFFTLFNLPLSIYYFSINLFYLDERISRKRLSEKRNSYECHGNIVLLVQLIKDV